MKIPTLGFVLIIIVALGIGVAIQYYGRTCPGCQRRKQLIADAISGNGVLTETPTPGGLSAPEDIPTVTYPVIKPLVEPTIL